MSVFSASDWYWFVGGIKTQVYSSSVGDYVQVNDQAYQSWLKLNSPTSINTEGELGRVLASYVDSLSNKASTILSIQQDIRQAELDKLLRNNADMVTLIQGGNSTTTTATTVATYLSNGTNNYRSLRAQIANAATPEAVRAVNINGGWPPNP